MAYDEVVAARVRRALSGRRGVAEKHMFGGVVFMLHGNMCIGVEGERLMARVGRDDYEATLDEPYVSPMDFTGKPLTGFVFVAPAGFVSDTDLGQWVARCVRYVETLPRK